jgi:hypothetical protein
VLYNAADAAELFIYFDNSISKSMGNCAGKSNRPLNSRDKENASPVPVTHQSLMLGTKITIQE